MSQTVGTQFKSQLASLLSTIRSTSPHYVRCLKPNGSAVPREFEREGIVGQLRCGGVLEAVRVARLGYPVRNTHAQFCASYRRLAPPATPGTDARAAAAALLAAMGVVEGVQIGSTKVRGRAPEGCARRPR